MEKFTQNPNTLEIKQKMQSHEKLQIVMSRYAKEINKEVETKYGIVNLVTPTLHIDEANFSHENGSVYSMEDINDDKETVRALDRYNCAADNPSTQKFYKETEDIDTPEGIVEYHLKKKEVSKSNQAEMVITALLHKVMKERFLVVRASIFDDYKHGIDNLILDKETGAVICGFDEVLRNESDANKPSTKLEKIKKKAIAGGAEAKYGVTLKDGKITRDKVRNIPVFYLTLESRDLSELTNDIYNISNGTLGKAEQKLFRHLVGSIKEQKAMLEGLNLPPVMRRKLEGFESSLAILESFVAK